MRLMAILLTFSFMGLSTPAFAGCHTSCTPGALQASHSGFSASREGGVTIYRGRHQSIDRQAVANFARIEAAEKRAKARQKALARQSRETTRLRAENAVLRAENARRLQNTPRRTGRRFFGNNRFFGRNGFIGNRNFSGATVSLGRGAVRRGSGRRGTRRKGTVRRRGR